MELKKVTAKLKPDELAKFKSVLKVMKYTKAGFAVENLVYKDKVFLVEVSFEVSPENYNAIVEKLSLNKIKLEIKDEESSKIIEGVNQELQRGKNKNVFMGWTGATEKKENTKDYSFEGISNDGNYEELIRITRDVSATKEEVAMAASKIDYAINNALKKAYEPALQDQFYAEGGIRRLLQIAGDPNLTLINKNDFKLKAGLQAINLSVKHKDFNSSLITIANNSKVDNYISVTAAVRLAGILVNNTFLDKKLVDPTVKDLNIKWLTSILGGVKHKFAEKELKDFESMVKYIKKNRVK